MKLNDLDRVNHLVRELEEVRGLMAMADRADTGAYQVFIEAPGDASLKMSSEGATTAHANGIAVSPAFLGDVKRLAGAELRRQEQEILQELRNLGVETGGQDPR